SSGSLCYADPAARFYETPPQLAEERWLFEWQPGEVLCPWPVMANKLASRKTNIITQFGLLGQSLTSLLGLTHRTEVPLSAELLTTDGNVYYVVSSSRYCALLTYELSQLDRLIKSLQDLVLTTEGAAARTAPTLQTPRIRHVPAPAAQLSGLPEVVDPVSEQPSAAATTPLPPASPLPGQPAHTAEPPGWGHDAAVWFEAAALASFAGPSAVEHGLSLLAPVASTPAAPCAESAASMSSAAPLSADSPSLPAPVIPAAELAPADSSAAAALHPVAGPSAVSTPPVASEPPAASAPPAVSAPLAASALPVASELAVASELPAVSEPPAAPMPSAAPDAILASEPPAVSAMPDSPAPLAALAPPEPLAPEPDEKPLLVLRGFTACVDERTVLKEVDLRIASRGVYCLMGPGGSGKSSLLGVLGGRYRCAFGWSLTGTVSYNGRALGPAARPAVIGQKIGHPAVPLREFLVGELEEEVAQNVSPAQLAALLARVGLVELAAHLDAVLGTPPLALSKAQWWQLAIGRELAADPALLCVDEPTAGLGDAEAESLLSILRTEAQQRAVLFVTHNQQHARMCSDYMILFAGGRVQEFQPTAAFFATPQSQPAKDFVRTGGCVVPSPDAKAEQLEPEITYAAAHAPDDPQAVEPQPAAARDVPAATNLPAPEALVTAAPLPTDSGLDIIWACPQATAVSLRLRGFGLKMGEQVVLSGISLDAAERGVHLLVTPDGAHKRLFLRALCGPRPSRFELLGEAAYCGRPLLDAEGPATPRSDPRLAMLSARDYLTESLPSRSSMDRAALNAYVLTALKAGYWQQQLMARLDVAMCDLETTQRRVLEILRAAQGAPALLVLDDPLAGVGEQERPHLLGLLAAQAAKRALLLLVNDPGPFLAFGFTSPPSVAWLSEGRLQAALPPPPAVAAPTPAPAPARTAESAAEAPLPRIAVPPPGDSPRSLSGPGPRGFRWLRQGALAGMPAPGLTNDLEYDLDLIHQTGITHLVTLTTEALPEAPLQARGIASLFFPIEDMDAPALPEALALCRQVAGLLEKGHAVGYHCKAGMGRTGTMLAAQLVFEGLGASDALTQARSVERGWVQSDKQVRFLSQFSDWLRQQIAPAGDSSTASSGMSPGTSNQPSRRRPTQ
ncbi:ATP-binding cassette domain-containing protein, partial [Haliangium sp. UPWRP_2]|uniref:phosphatase domain-containing putative toxin n=1 Tax=Haliangium sp. UPWRP_2 TaxID=1931276 RepID=UPI000D0CCFFD